MSLPFAKNIYRKSSAIAYMMNLIVVYTMCSVPDYEQIMAGDYSQSPAIIFMFSITIFLNEQLID